MSQPQYESGVIGAGQWVGVGAGCVNDVNAAGRPNDGNGPGANTIYPPNLVGQMSCGIAITGTWTGTIVFEGTMDGTTYQACSASPFGGGAPVQSTTANGLFVAAIPGCTGFRVRATAMTNGEATVTLSATDAQPPPGAGTSIASGLSSTAVGTSVSATQLNILGNLLSANSSRQGFMIQNNSTQVLDVAFGTTAFTTAYGASIAPGGSLTMPPPVDFTGSVSGVWTGAVGSAQVTEFKP